MGHYLRDFQFSNLNISSDTFTDIDAIFKDINKKFSEVSNSDPIQSSPATVWSYVIRFDGKGYRVFYLNDLLSYYKKARSVERVTFSVDTIKSIESNRLLGSYVDLRLDSKDSANNILVVSADDKDLVDSTFARIADVLNSCKSRNGWIRNGWTNLIVQLFGVSLGFILSILGAIKIAPMLKIESSLIFCFIFVLVMYSNVWSLVNFQLVKLVNYVFPNIKFINDRKDGLDHLVQTLMDGVVLTIILYFFSKTGSWLLGILANLVNAN